MENMKNIPMHKRPNIGIDRISEFENGGLCIESKEVNGVLMYVPYGIWCDLFGLIDSSSMMIVNRIDNLRNLIKQTEEAQIKNGDSIILDFKRQIDALQKQLDFINAISPLCDEV